MEGLEFKARSVCLPICDSCWASPLFTDRPPRREACLPTLRTSRGPPCPSVAWPLGGTSSVWYTGKEKKPVKSKPGRCLSRVGLPAPVSPLRVALLPAGCPLPAPKPRFAHPRLLLPQALTGTTGVGGGLVTPLGVTAKGNRRRVPGTCGAVAQEWEDRNCLWKPHQKAESVHQSYTEQTGPRRPEGRGGRGEVGIHAGSQNPGAQWSRSVCPHTPLLLRAAR